MAINNSPNVQPSDYGTAIPGSLPGVLYGDTSLAKAETFKVVGNVPYGTVVVGVEGDDKRAYTPIANDQLKVVFGGGNADFVADNVITVEVDSKTITAEFATDQLTTMAKIILAINEAALNLVATLDVTDANNRTLLISTPGRFIPSTDVVVTVTGGATQPNVTITNQNSVNRRWLGVVIRRIDEPVVVGSMEQVLGRNETFVSVLREGQISGLFIVDGSNPAPRIGQTVKVLTSGVDAGKFTMATGGVNFPGVVKHLVAGDSDQYIVQIGRLPLEVS